MVTQKFLDESEKVAKDRVGVTMTNLVTSEPLRCKNGCDVKIDTLYNARWDKTSYDASCQCGTGTYGWDTPERAVRALNRIIRSNEEIAELMAES